MSDGDGVNDEPKRKDRDSLSNYESFSQGQSERQRAFIKMPAHLKKRQRRGRKLSLFNSPAGPMWSIGNTQMSPGGS